MKQQSVYQNIKWPQSRAVRMRLQSHMSYLACGAGRQWVTDAFGSSTFLCLVIYRWITSDIVST